MGLKSSAILSAGCPDSTQPGSTCSAARERPRRTPSGRYSIGSVGEPYVPGLLGAATSLRSDCSGPDPGTTSATEVIVLDDMVAIFKSDVALQILLSALEHPTGRERSRVVKYQPQRGKRARAVFPGWDHLHHQPRTARTRICSEPSRAVSTSLNYDPSDARNSEQLMLSVCRVGMARAVLPTVTPEEGLRTVAEFVISETSSASGARFRSAAVFQQGAPRLPAVEAGRRDRIGLAATWVERVDRGQTPGRHSLPRRPAPRRTERKSVEHAIIVEEILRDCQSREDRVSEWIRRTGKSERAFYRRLAEIR